MALIKNPEEDINELEEILFNEVFSDINTPGFWIAETEKDLEMPKIIILDGHSTILTYDQSDEELPWTAHTELGQYKYTPNNIGDGVVIFPHNFYYEVTIRLPNKEFTADATFDGNSISAITLPLKGVGIDDIFNIVRNRIEEAISSEMESITDSIVVEENLKIIIPDAIGMKIGMKLSLMGISLVSLKPKSINLITKQAPEGEIVEQVFEEQSERSKEILSQEVKKKKKKDTRARSIMLGRPAKVDTSARAGGGASIQPPPPPAPEAPPAPATTSAPTPPPTVAPKPTAPPQPEAKPKIAKKEDIEPIPAVEMVEAMEDLELQEEESGITDRLIAKGMDVREEKLTLRYTHASYFSRMLLNRAYPLLVKISLEEIGVKKSVSSVVSGEKLSEKEASMLISEDDPNVTIRPEFPGCFVVPSEQTVDIREEKIEVKFHVTPLALGTLDGSIKFTQGTKVVHSMMLETKVITHRVSKWLAGIGASTSVIPTAIAFLLNETPAQFMEKRMDTFAPSINVDGLAILGVLTAIFLFFSGFVYRLQRPKRTSHSLAFPR